MSKQDNAVMPFSYHTFIFPFIWNDNGKVTQAQFQKCMHPDWSLDTRADTPYDPSRYGQYAYFNQAAHNVIFTEEGDNKPIVRNFRFNIGKLCSDESWLGNEKGKGNKVCYVIQKDIYRWDNATKSNVYDHTFVANLCVNGIRLRLFSTGVGMIVFELENYAHNTEKEITLINEYGRRVFMPYVTPEGHCPLCADTITLKYPGGEIISTISGAKPKKNSDIRFPDLIMFLLRNGNYAATTQPTSAKDQFFIEPIIDDRMFVACVWNDDTITAVAKQDVDGQYRYLADALQMPPEHPDNLARRLYELVFVDGTGLSCQNKQMLHQALSEHVYARWIEYGTLTGVTEYSLVSVTNFAPNITAFLTEYVEMAMLVLAQRASLLAFERQISDCARGELRVNKIQREYVQFQSKYLLREVTPQQQGIELYKMMLEKLFIDDMQDDVENQINALFALERDISDRDDNWLLFILATLGVFEAVSFFTSEPGCHAVVFSLLAIGGLLLWFLRNHRNRLK